MHFPDEKDAYLILKKQNRHSIHIKVHQSNQKTAQIVLNSMGEASFGFSLPFTRREKRCLVSVRPSPAGGSAIWFQLALHPLGEVKKKLIPCLLQVRKGLLQYLLTSKIINYEKN